MKTNRTRKLLSLVLSLAMVMGMLVLPASAAVVTSTLEATDSALQTSGGTVINNNLTFTVACEGVVDRSKTIEGTSFTKAISFSGKSEGKAARSIAFTTTTSSTIKVWWERNDTSKTSQLTLWEAAGKGDTTAGISYKTGTAAAANNETHCDTLTEVAAGTYRLGIATGKGYIYKVEVTWGTAASADEIELTFNVDKGLTVTVDDKAVTAPINVAKNAEVSFKVTPNSNLYEVKEVKFGETVLTAGADGVYTIADVGDANATVTITAESSEVPATKVTISGGSTANMKVNGTATLTAATEPTGTCTDEVTWTSRDEGIATVSDAGVVTAEGIGKTTITATAGTQTDTRDVIVTGADQTGKSYTFESKKMGIVTAYGENTEVKYDNHFSVMFGSSTKVDANSKSWDDYSSGHRLGMGGAGSTSQNALKITTGNPATVKIWWVSNKAGGRMALQDNTGAAVTNQETAAAASANAVSNSELSIPAAGTYYLVSTGTQEDGSSAGGNYLFKVEVTEEEAEQPPEPVVPVVSSVTIEDGGSAATTKTVTYGDAAFTLTAEVAGTNLAAEDETVTWASDTEAVATVAADGKVTIKKAGTAKITATSTKDTDKKAELTLTVNKATVTVELEVDKDHIHSADEDGRKVEFTATVTPVEAGAATIKCEEDPDVEVTSPMLLPDETKTHSFVASVAESDNYKAASSEPVTVAVTKSDEEAPTVYTIISDTAVIKVNGKTGNQATKGVSVTVTANAAPEGKVFDKWTATGITLSADDEVKNPLTFKMPDNAVTINATYKDAATEPDVPPDGPPTTGTFTITAAEVYNYLKEQGKTEDGEKIALDNGVAIENQGTNGIFTVYPKKSGNAGSIDKNSRKWDDLTAEESAKRFNFGGNSMVMENGSENITCVIKFTIGAPATVKVWWGTKTANAVALYVAGTAAPKYTSETVTVDENTSYTSTISATEAGTYYLGGTVDGAKGNFYPVKVEVNITGTVEPDRVDTTALEQAITAATTAKNGAKISTDGADVYTSYKWTTQAEVDKLAAAITAAQAVVDDEDVTEEAVTAAIATLNAAVDAFKATLQSGTKVASGDMLPTGPSGGGSASSSTTTVTNDDGSKTTTKTDAKTGAVTETTTWSNGDKQVVVTAKDGTKTDTMTKSDGTKTETVIKPDGETTAKVTLPSRVDKAVVTIPVEATDGTVAVIVKADGTEQVIKTSMAGENGLELLVDKSVTVKIKDNAKKFDDIADDYWAKGAVDFVSSREIFKGVYETVFAPADEVNRGMMATVLYRLADAKAEGENVFFDVDNGNWYTDAVVWANNSGVVTGYADGNFGPADAITREQMAAMLFRFAKVAGIDTAVKGDVSKFSDGADVSSWASEAMAWAVGVGVINGVGDPVLGTILAPAKSASRAEVATIMQRMVKLMMQ